MQPIYLTQSSSGSSPWKPTNWHCTGMMGLGFQVLSTGGSSWTVDFTLEDPTGTFVNPRSTTPTAFVLLTGSANVVTSITSLPIAAYRLTLNVPSSAGASVTLVSLQTGIG